MYDKKKAPVAVQSTTGAFKEINEYLKSTNKIANPETYTLLISLIIED